jgi:hypothetical protein
MSTFFDAEDLRAYGRSRPARFEELRSFSEKRAASSVKFDIFLSHSNLDRGVITGLYYKLCDEGYSVYAYWITDPDLDNAPVSKASVQKVRKRMRQCNSLLFALSLGATDSRWMPWELGFMDGMGNACVILPIQHVTPKAMEGQDFLSVYPLVKEDALARKGYIFRVEENGDAQYMKDVLKNQNPF